MTSFFIFIGLLGMGLWSVKFLFGKKPDSMKAANVAASTGTTNTTDPEKRTQTLAMTSPSVRDADRIEIPISINSPGMTAPLQVGSITLQSSLAFERDDVLADLNRRATDAKEAKDWKTAIALLRQAKSREGKVYEDTRLAMYLQQSGQFAESLVEFDWLLSMVQSQVDGSEVPMSPSYRQSRIAHAKANIHNKIRIAASREKRADLVGTHQALHSQYQDEVDKLAPVLEREWKKERRAYAAKEARLEKKRQARAAL